MGRKKNILIRRYYNFEDGKNNCKICEKNFIGTSLTNLKRHLNQAHANMLNIEEEEELQPIREKKKKFK